MAKVRIKDQDRRAGLSIAVVVGAAVVLWFSWLMWSIDASIPTTQRTPPGITMLYGCDHGHLFEAPGGDKSLPCKEPSCPDRAWPLWTLQCSRHGGLVMQLRYAADGGAWRIAKARVLGGAWQDVEQDIICPRCERALLPDLSLRRGLLVRAAS